MEKERQKIVQYSRKMVHDGLVTGTSGNLSILNGDGDMMAISPSGLPPEEMTEGDVVIINREGKLLHGTGKPSSEYLMHLAVYKSRKDLRAVVHTHSEFATVLACTGMDLPPIHYMIAFAGDRVPRIPYAPFGSHALAEKVSEGIKDANALLLANHGLIAGGISLPRAYTTAESVEFTAKIYYRSMLLGEPHFLSPKEMAEVKQKFQTYGQGGKANGTTKP